MQPWLNKLLNVRPGEWPKLLMLALILVITNLGTVWGPNLAAATFLKQADPRAGLITLTWSLLLSSILSIVGLVIYSAFIDRVDNNRMYAYLFMAGGGIILVSMALLWLKLPDLAYPLLYVLTIAWLAILNSHFYIYINELYDIHVAKRILPIILAAGRSCAALSGFSLKFMTNHFSPEEIIWFWFASDFVIAGLVIAIPYVLKEPRKTHLESTRPTQAPKGNTYIQGMREGLNITLKSDFLRWVAVGTLLLMALMTLVEYYVGKIMPPQFPTREAYAGFLGWLDGISNLIALVILLFGISRLTKSWGVGNISLVFPNLSLLINGGLSIVPLMSGGLASFPALTSASLGYINRRGLRFSLQSPIDALLYNAIPVRDKSRARAFVGGLVAPLGTIFAVCLLVLELQSGAEAVWLIPGAIALLSLAYSINAFIIRKQYTSALVKMLEEEDYSFLVSNEASELAAADPATLQRLQKKLEESTSHEMRIFMTQLIAQVGGDESLSILIPTLKTTIEARTRAAMLNVLTAAGLSGDKVKSLYVDCLADADQHVRRAAASGLEQLLGIKDRWFQEQLLGMVNDADAQVSLYALQSLTNTGEFYKFDVVVQKLDQLLNSDSVEYKKDAIGILSKIGQPRAIKQILTFLDDEDDQLRLEASLKLENLELPLGNALDAKILEKIKPLTKDPVARVRQAVLQVMGKYKNTADYATLVSAMADKSPQVRTTVINILVGIGKDVVPLIQAELKTPDLQIQNMAAVALSRIQPRQYANLIETIVSSDLSKIYQNVSLEQALGPYNKHRSVRVLLVALREINHEQVDEILYLLSAIHNPETLKIVKDSLNSELPSTRNLALEALESLTSPKVAALIASLFEPLMNTTQLLQLGKDSLNIEQLDLPQAFEKLLSPTEPRILRLLALHALGDIICGAQPSQPRKSTNKAARLWDALEAPVEQPATEPALPSELQPLLEKAQSDPEPLIRQSAQTALQKIENSQAEVQNGGAASTAGQEPAQLSVVERLIILKETSFLRSISITQLETLAMVCEQKKYQRDACIFKKDDPGGVLYIVVDGQVGIEQEKRVGSALLATIENGSYFGEMSLFDNSPRSASATALNDCSVLELNRAPIIMLTMQNPDLALELINILSQRIRETSNRVAETARSRPRELHKLYDQFDD